MGWIAVDQERAELECVLASSLFRKAPNQSRLLRYLCDRHFEGLSEQPKEHQIAIEALGRRENFDGREDSIVRVEAWRLRRRLRQYYDSEGNSHRLRIALDPGQYVARFVSSDAPPIDEPAEPEPVISLEHIGGPRHSLPWRVPVAAVIAVVLVTAGIFLVRRGTRPTHSETLQPISGGAEIFRGAPADGAVRILAGYDRPTHIDRMARVWQGDRYFSGGQAAEPAREFIGRTADPTIFRHCRIGNFDYHIPLRPGVYELRLYFGPGVRAWTVTDQPMDKYPMTLRIGDAEQRLNLNLAADGAATPTPDIRVFKDVAPGTGGTLHLGFWTAGQYGFVNAIELTPGVRGRLKPIRIVARDYFYTDRAGNIWPPDRFYRGGTVVERSAPATRTDDPDLFSSERFGKQFDYVIPVAQGVYSVTLGFSEMWFGPKLPGGGGEGSRRFDVSCNGSSLLKDFDLFRQAGGAGRALVRTFHGLRPDEDGKLRLSFTATRNNALINFIEVDDESK